MSTKLYWDKEKKLIQGYDPEELTPQQRGNLVFLQGLINHEFQRGFERGLEVGRSEMRRKLENRN